MAREYPESKFRFCLNPVNVIKLEESMEKKKRKKKNSRARYKRLSEASGSRILNNSNVLSSLITSPESGVKGRFSVMTNCHTRALSV